MDPTLRALCVEVLHENIDSEKFAWLLIETGVNVESYEWDVANHLLRQGDANAEMAKKFGMTLQ